MKRFPALVALFFLFTNSASAAPIYTFPVADCAVKYVRSHHDYPATDILAKKGCAFVSPINGVIEDAIRVDKWSGKTNLGEDRGGLAISIIGDDGVRYYGSHLSKILPEVITGLRVISGQKLGEVGASGSAKGTAPHLHFGISYPSKAGDWKIRRGVVYPWKYLDSWKIGEDKSPVAEVLKAKAKVK